LGFDLVLDDYDVQETKKLLVWSTPYGALSKDPSMYGRMMLSGTNAAGEPPH